MTWISRTGPAPSRPRLHNCKPPTAWQRWGGFQPDGCVGDVWMCDDCGRIWKIKYLIGGMTHWSEVSPLFSAWYRRVAKRKKNDDAGTTDRILG